MSKLQVTASIRPDQYFSRELPVYTWPIPAVAFSALVVLIGFFHDCNMARCWRDAASVRRLDDAYRQADGALEAIRTHIYTSSLIVRDYVMDKPGNHDGEHKEFIYRNRAQVPAYLAEIRNSIGPAPSVKLDSLQNELNAYWTSLDPIFELKPKQKQRLGYKLLRTNVISRRQSVIRLAGEIETLIAANLQAQ